MRVSLYAKAKKNPGIQNLRKVLILIFLTVISYVFK